MAGDISLIEARKAHDKHKIAISPVAVEKLDLRKMLRKTLR
jgi:hypothetical protein